MFVRKHKTGLVSLLALGTVAAGLGSTLDIASGHVEGQEPGAKDNSPKPTRVETPSGKDKGLEKKLQATGDFSYKNVMLRDILHELAEEKGINIVIDPSANGNRGLVEDRSVELPVSLQLRDVTLETAFRHLVEAGNLGYRKQDGVLVVTSKERSMVRKVYAVRPLIENNEERDVPALITAIVAPCEPGTWFVSSDQKLFPFPDRAAQPNGGTAPMGDVTTPEPVAEGGPANIQTAGTIAYFPATKALVVHHFPGVHREIEELLTNLAAK